MTKDMTQYLEFLGLSETERKLYLSLLQTGPVSVEKLAKTVGIPRTSAYTAIKPLLDKELIIKVIKKGTSVVEAYPPQDIIPQFAEKKVQENNILLGGLSQMAKSLQQSYLQGRETGSDESQIRMYKGKFGVKKIYEEILKAKEQRSYVDITKIEEVFPENFQKFRDGFVDNPQMKMYEIHQNASTEKTKSYLKFVHKGKNYFYKLLPEGVTLGTQDIIIYDNRVAIISFNKVISGVVMQNQDLYKTFKTLFDVMWQLLPEIKIDNKK